MINKISIFFEGLNKGTSFDTYAIEDQTRIFYYKKS